MELSLLLPMALVDCLLCLAASLGQSSLLCSVLWQ
jgi:hypothetical protein